jgi:hypothetical protein
MPADSEPCITEKLSPKPRSVLLNAQLPSPGRQKRRSISAYPPAASAPNHGNASRNTQDTARDHSFGR